MLDLLCVVNCIVGVQFYCWSVVFVDGWFVIISCGLLVQVDGVFQLQYDCDLLIVVVVFNVMCYVMFVILLVVCQGVRCVWLIGGVEVGSWVLVMVGLLDWCKVIIYWEDFEDFVVCFLQVCVIFDCWVVDGLVFIIGGVVFVLDFMLVLICVWQGFGVVLNVVSFYVYEEVWLFLDVQLFVLLGWVGWLEQCFVIVICIMEEYLDSFLFIVVIVEWVGCLICMLEGLFCEIVEILFVVYYQLLWLQVVWWLIIDIDLGMVDVVVWIGFVLIVLLLWVFRWWFGYLFFVVWCSL